MYYRLLDELKLVDRQLDSSAGDINLFLQRFLRWFGALQATAGEAAGPTASRSLSVELGKMADLVLPSSESLERFILSPEPSAPPAMEDAKLRELQEVFASLHLGPSAPSMARVVADMSGCKTPLGRGVPAWASVAYAAAALPA